MKLSKYGMFIEIYESGSFSNAAEKFNYTPSAISQLVSSLEEELGMTLLHRSKKGLSLTTEGEKLMPFIYDIYNSEIRLSDSLTDSQNNVKGIIRIGSMDSIASYLLPAVIKSFQSKFPLVEFQIMIGNYKETANHILSGKVDLGFVRNPVSLQLDTITFRSDSLVLAMHRENPLARYEICPVEVLEKEPIILLDDGHSDEIENYFRRNHIKPDIRFKIKGNLAVLSFVNNGLGVSIIPKMLIQSGYKDIVSRSLNPPLKRSMAIGCKNRDKLSRVNKLFLNELIEYGQRMIGE